MSEAFELTEREFQTLSGLLRDRMGLDYPPQKRAEIEKACRPLSDGLDAAEFCCKLASPSGEGLLQRLVNRLTVGETYFFRIQAHFDALQSVILPGLYEKRAAEKRLRIWSAGCASGEEPYSVAMLILETLPDAADWEIEFLGTDVNTDFLAAARRGRYREWSFRKVDEYWRQKYFKRVEGEWHIAPEVRAMVNFVQANLVDERDGATAGGPALYDLILCRNVFIYFDEDAIERASSLFRRNLASGGWFVSGHAEPFVYGDDFEAVNFPGAFVYRKLTPEEAAAARKPPRPKPRPPKAVRVAPARNALERADRLVAAGEDSEALEQLSDLVAARDDVELYWRMGRVLGNLGRYEEGLDWCRRGAALDKTNPHCYYIAALIEEEMGDNDKAFENLRRSLYVDKDFVLGHFSMASYHRWRRDEERAVRSYRNVLRLLEGRPEHEEISGDGLTVGRLREIVNQIL
jgi:chemotaxis protein methyltransferase CheR